MRSTLFTALVLTIALSLAAFGQLKKAKTEMKAEAKTDQKSEMKSGGSMKGYVVDVMCGKDMATAEGGAAKAAKHKRSCALEENCVSSGFGLISGGKWYQFDAEGSKKAQAWIESTKKKDNLMVEVTGKQDGDKYTLASIKEASDAKETKSEKKTEKKSDTKKD